MNQVSPHEIAARVSPALPKGYRLATVQRVPTGLALVPAQGEDPKKLAAAGQKIASLCGSCTAETADHWRRFYLPNAPYRIRTLAANGNTTEPRDVIEPELQEELKNAFGASPKRFYWCRTRLLEDPDTRPLLVCFSQSDLARIPREISLFHKRVRVLESTRRPRVAQCQRCWAFHREEYCANRIRCGICASPQHHTDEHVSQAPSCGAAPNDCRCPPKCVNCLGPHQANDPGCPVRPKVSRNTGVIQRPSRQQTGSIRSGMASTWQKAAAACPGRKPLARNETMAAMPDTPTPAPTVEPLPTASQC